MPAPSISSFWSNKTHFLSRVWVDVGCKEVCVEGGVAQFENKELKTGYLPVIYGLLAKVAPDFKRIWLWLSFSFSSRLLSLD